MDDGATSEMLVLPKHVINIVWQYAPENQSHLTEQKRHLAMLRSSGLIAMQDREELLAGSLRDSANNIEHADMIVSLISSHLLSSSDGCGISMQDILGKHQDGKIYVLPVYVSSCPYHDAPIGQLPIITAKGQAITHWHGDDRQKAYALAAEEIRKVVEILLALKWRGTAEDFYEQNAYDLALNACKNTLRFYEMNSSFYSNISDKSLLQRFHNALASCYILQAKILFELKHFEEVLGICLKGCQIQTSNPFFCFYKGHALYCLNRFEEATEALNTSVGQFEEERKTDEAGILYKEDLYSAYIALGRACEKRAEQERQKWLQQRDEADRMAQKLRAESKRKRLPKNRSAGGF